MGRRLRRARPKGSIGQALVGSPLSGRRRLAPEDIAAGNLPLKQSSAPSGGDPYRCCGGVDVVETGRAAAQAARDQAEAAKAQSLGAIAEQYLTDAARRLRPTSLRVARLYLRNHWQALHDRPADELGRREIVAVLEPYAGRATSDADAAAPECVPVVGHGTRAAGAQCGPRHKAAGTARGPRAGAERKSRSGRFGRLRRRQPAPV